MLYTLKRGYKKVEKGLFLGIPMWLIFSLIATFAWGLEDVFLKVIAKKGSPHFSLKISTCTGVISVPFLFYLTNKSESGLSLLNLLMSDLTLLLMCIAYTLVLVIAFIGAKYLDASIYAPIENASNGFEIIMILGYAFITGNYSHVSNSITPLSISGMVLTIGGIIVLVIAQKSINDKALKLDPQNKMYRNGTLALLFPLGVCIIDALSTVLDSINLGVTGEAVIGVFDYMRFYTFANVVVGVLSWLIIFFRTKKAYNPFRKGERFNYSCSISENSANVFYIFAMSQNAILSIPVTTSYCIVTLILSRIFLKEKLNFVQKICVTAVVVGVMLISLVGLEEG